MSGECVLSMTRTLSSYARRSPRTRHAGEHSELASPPPRASAALGREVREPVLPPDGAHERRRRPRRKWIAAEQPQHARAVLEQPLLRQHDPGRLLPRAERREPEVPLEPRLVRRIDARPLERILRLVPEGVRYPRDAVAAPLELDLVARLGHHGEQPIRVRDPERREQARRQREW